MLSLPGFPVNRSYPHQAGMGEMVKDKNKSKPGSYQGYLSENTVTIAEVLKKAGYYCS